jgi:hypothetical protein
LLLTVPLTQSIAELESVAKEGGLRYVVPESILDQIENDFIRDTLDSAYRDIPASSVKALLSNIRNRVLDFSLSLEDVRLQAEVAQADQKPVSASSIDERFRIYVLGDSNVVNVAGQTASISAQQVQILAGDVVALKSFLTDLGTGDAEIKQLDKVIAAAKPTDLKDSRSGLRRWIDRAAKSIAEGGGKLAETAAKELVMLSIRYYFGEMTGIDGGPPNPSS